jgi:phosphoglycerol transferase MdoB-like AlkP superfamily enzyme
MSSTFVAPHGSFRGSPLAFVLSATGILLLGDLLMRVAFLAYNAGGGWEYAAGDLPLALLVGVRFDIAALAVFGGLPLVIAMLPIASQDSLVRRVPLWLLLMHLPVHLLNGIDVIYFGFASKRLSHEFFSGGKEAMNVGFGEFLSYWWLVIVVGLLVAGQWWLLRRAARRMQKPAPGHTLSRRIEWLAPLMVAALLFLGFRGGLQTRPLRPANAFVSGSVFLGNVSLNSAYTVLQSLDIGSEDPVSVMPLDAAIRLARATVRNDFDGPFQSEEYPLLRASRFPGPERRHNVVLLIVESLNANKLGCLNGKPLAESLTPNLDTLARRGRLHTQFFSNGARSVQSLPAILNSTPDIFDRPLIGSSFETNRQWGIGNILKQRGYHTSFLCGGPNGTLGFDAYSRISGFDHYYGQGDYAGPDPHIADKWGLHDHPALGWLADLQSGFPQPFLSTWFSISNHHPFALPADCPPVIARSNLSAMDKTVRYTDWALGQYFDRVLRTDWGRNTIFVLTGDHCFYFDDDPDRGDVQNYHVPLILFGPGIAPAVDDRAASHISILPTLLELLHVNTRYAGVGVSVLSQQNAPFGLTGVMGVESLVRNGHYYSTTFNAPVCSYRFAEGGWTRDNALVQTPTGRHTDSTLRALYQVCSYMRQHDRQNLPKGMEE